MDAHQIENQYMQLFAKSWNDPALVSSLRELRTDVAQVGMDDWLRIIDARIARAEQRFGDALTILEQVLSQDPGNMHAMFLKSGILSIEPKTREEAIRLADVVIETLRSNEDYPSRLTCAMAMYNKANVLSELGRHEEALAANDAITTTYGDEVEPELRKQVIESMVNRGSTLGRLGRPSEALAICDAVITAFCAASEPKLPHALTSALINKAIALSELDRPEESLAVCDVVISDYSDADDPGLRERVSKAMLTKASMLRRLGRRNEQLAVYDRVIGMLDEGCDLGLRVQVAEAMLNKASTVGELGQPEEELAIYDHLIATFSGACEPKLRLQVARAIVNKGITLDDLGRWEQALAVFDTAIVTFATAQQPELRQQVANAMVAKGITLGELGRAEEEVAVYDTVLTRFRGETEPALAEPLARAMVNAGVTLAELGRPEEALRIDDELMARFGNAKKPELQLQVAMGMLNRGLALHALGRLDEAMAIWQAHAARFGDSAESELRELATQAMFNNAIALGKSGEPDKQLAALEDLVAKWSKSQESAIRSLAGRAAVLASQLKQRLNAPDVTQSERKAINLTRGSYSENLTAYLAIAQKHVDEQTREEYFARMKESRRRHDLFLSDESQFTADASLLLVLREWNSYTPALPAEEERDRGGGYFLLHRGEGVVIDPGYDFLQNFFEAGGRLCDIDHVVVTHAHDDHTAELEAILMLLHQRASRPNAKGKSHQISLYLSEGCQRKFSGIIPLREDRRIARIVTMSRPGRGCSQQVQLSPHVRMTVLPAYHDDVVTRDTAVGLGFELILEDGRKRRIVFTGDTGYYPVALEADGKPQRYPGDSDRLRLDAAPSKGLDRQYPTKFRTPELLVVHIGSIKEEEFRPIPSQFSGPAAAHEKSGPAGSHDKRREEGEWYYGNHLGLLGTLTMLDKLRPKAAIISEFGAELKGFHIELVKHIAEALEEKQKEDNIATRTFVAPGDLTMVYYVAQDKFLCHEDCSAHAASDLNCKAEHEWRVTRSADCEVPNVNRGDTLRAHLCTTEPDVRPDISGIRDYYENLAERRLPHFK